jgi:hypothetical protein
MKKRTAYTAIIMTAIAILFAVNANAQYSVTSVNDFQLRLICQHTVDLIGGSSNFLGTFIAGQSYTLPSGQSGADNGELVFKLTGQTGENYTVTSITANSVGTTWVGTIEYQWYYDEDGGGYVSTGSASTELAWTGDLDNGTPGACNGVCYFKIAATSITTSSNTPHGTTFEFPVDLTAEVNL